MKDFIAAIFGLIIVVVTLIWMVIAVLGSAEILWWIITGDFFHFVNTTPAVVSTF